MASKFVRGAKWWIKCRHPATGQLIRESLETSDEARAELLRQRITLEVELLQPRFQAVTIPDALRNALKLKAAADAANGGGDAPQQRSEMPFPNRTPCRTSIEKALAVYYKFIESDNAPHHVANKLSKLRRFFGRGRVQKIIDPTGTKFPAKLGQSDHPTEAFFNGTYLDEITPGIVQEFIERRKICQKTKRHYRELFHHFFEVCLKNDLYQPSNLHRPNPIAALPSYVTRNHRIVFLNKDQIDEQLTALDGQPEIQLAVALMIYAGLRRSEALWLTRDSIAADRSFLSILNRVDQDEDIEGSLKTGQRSVTILPPLKAILEDYLPRLRSDWLIPKPDGKRWGANGFSRKLRKINEVHKLKWTCLHFRHTYATQRAAEGWPLFRIAKEMGNSCGMVEQHYAAFVRPE